jgi:hypothetical protein
MAKGDKFGGGGPTNYSGWSPEVASYVSNMGNWRASAGNPATYGDIGHYQANQSAAQGENLYRQRQAIEWANQQKMSDPAYWAQAFGMNMGGGGGGGDYGYKDTSEPYRTRLNALLDNPDAIANTGVYKFALGQGQEAVNRNLAAKGLLKSGNRLSELTKFGQGLASQQYGQEADRLSNILNQTRQADVSRYSADTGRYSADVQGQNQLKSIMMQTAMNQMQKNQAPQSYQTPGGILTRW